MITVSFWGFCDFPIRTNVQKQLRRILLVHLSFIQLSAGTTSSALEYLHHSALKAVTSDNQGIDSATKIAITYNDIDTSLICYTT